MRQASVGVVVAVLLLSGCTSSDECGPGADCPKTVTVGEERYQVGCLPGGVRENVLEERVEDVAYGPAERFDTVTVEAREIRGVEVSEAVAIRIFGEGRSCGYDDESVWSWATAPQLPSERIEEIAGAISAGSRPSRSASAAKSSFMRPPPPRWLQSAPSRSTPSRGRARP